VIRAKKLEDKLLADNKLLLNHTPHLRRSGNFGECDTGAELAGPGNCQHGWLRRRTLVLALAVKPKASK
jgi:hypothetical protein